MGIEGSIANEVCKDGSGIGLELSTKEVPLGTIMASKNGVEPIQMEQQLESASLLQINSELI